METITIDTEFIKLDQLLKLAGLVETGAFAHDEIVSGNVKVNGVVATEKRKKIRNGDIVTYNNESVKVLVK